MSFIIVVLCLALLIVLISYFKVDAFIAFLISSILAGIALESLFPMLACGERESGG